jgi:(1->4)-alpha-D-glucan 1-alpha-D-glucosylmutase
MAEQKIPIIPTATYRLQFRNGMTFDKAIDLIPHWTWLGISHVYASPIFAAVSGSTHGYDVTDPNAIEPAIGGIDGFRRFSDGLSAAGLGLILDIVPNHMAASLENPYWRDVLKLGRGSRFAAFFDNDWDQALTLPVLGEPIEAVIAAGNARLRMREGSEELVFDYFGDLYPLDPATYTRPAGDQAATGRAGRGDFEDPLSWDDCATVALIQKQHWRMIHWREAASGLSYRRFFEITGLVGVRVEDEDVFDETHRLILGLVADGRVQGLRIDHVDGLADPAGYLARLREAVGPDTYLVVEKILEGAEQLPADWSVAGTTGYEFIADVAALLGRPSPELDRAWQALAPEFEAPDLELARAKRLMVDVNFAGEVTALIRRVKDLADIAAPPDLSEDMIADAVRSVVAGFDVYRTYGTAEGLSDQDRRVLKDMFARLRASAPPLRPALTFIEDLLLARVDAGIRNSALSFRTRLQHLTGPVLAKSLEDTFFYRHNRLIALNEVGGDPVGEADGHAGVTHFHHRMLVRQATQPHALTATATHDTKRGEDARARLYAISEAPADWTALTRRWREQLAHLIVPMADGAAPEPAVEWLIFQSLAGMLPPDFDPGSEAARQGARDRFLVYIEKALREAKLRTNWTDINEAYEQAVMNYAAAAIGSKEFMLGFWRDIRPFVETGFINSLTQTLLKLTAPGVPDIYQGTETADTSLVDPDNRRLPDYARLTSAGISSSIDGFTLAKTRLIRETLAFRKRYADLFVLGDYVALESTGTRADNVLAFGRRHQKLIAVTLVPRLVHDAVGSGMLFSQAYWADTAITLPEGARLRDAEHALAAGGSLKVADLFRTTPYALLIAEG